ncbi:MAG TPA: redox-regulated ATPase YchF [Sulfolobales archaeon]|nr:redox-regulated ATPase YchF [Sulfolobales archaeon]
MVTQTSVLVGIIGKTNVGKSTLFSALTMIPVKIENRPFVTLEPNVGIGYIRQTCPHKILGLPRCDARNSICIEGNRFVPVKIIDVPGLVAGAHEGRGLGNKFLDSLRQADVLIHVIDASGSTDPEGRPVKPGSYDPYDDVILIEREFDLWLTSIIKSDWNRLSKTLDSLPLSEAIERLSQRLSGLSIKKSHVVRALEETKLSGSRFSSWRDEELQIFVSSLRKISKPTIIAANKADIPEAIDIIKSLEKRLQGRIMVPISAEAELALRRASSAGLIRYIPGDRDYTIIDRGRMTPAQERALEKIRSFMERFGGTGVQRIINTAVLEALDMIVVYPVEDPVRMCDSNGNILPDAILARKGVTARELAYMIHTELGEGFLYAIDAKTKARLGSDHVLGDGDIVKIVSTRKKQAR